EKADNEKNFSEKAVISGLERLAFGSTNDAVSLIFAEDVTPAKIRQADLYNVSEIKKIKGGGVEIKFFDRQKAMEKLAEYSEKLNAQSNAKNLVETIYGNDSNETVTSDCPFEEAE
ncbi:MAG: terminase small subunit, partial [Ruminococcus sp.]|nr:terminase small subunit [Ruminococcus sp.]